MDFINGCLIFAFDLPTRLTSKKQFIQRETTSLQHTLAFTQIFISLHPDRLHSAPTDQCIWQRSAHPLDRQGGGGVTLAFSPFSAESAS